MQRQTGLSLWCERIIEGGWLLALTLIPIYFNLLSARHFEPDKATTLRAIVLLMAAAGLVRFMERFAQRSDMPAPAPPAESAPETPPGQPAPRFTVPPLTIPVLVYALVFVVTTITSVVPLTSFWGSYQRLQGTYTNLSYIGLFAMIVVTLRRREQFERIITVTLLTGLAVAGYGVLQHFQLDPLPWRGDVVARVASTMGNSIFVAAYMIMLVPLALYRLIAGLSEAQQAPPSAAPRADWLWAVAFGVLVFGTLALLLAVIKFGVAVRAADLRYWWVFPGAVAVTMALWTLLTVNLGRGGTTGNSAATPLWPGILFGVYLVLLGLLFAASSLVQAVNTDLPRAADWWLWLLISLIAVVVFYALAFALPRRAAEPSRLALRLQAAGALVVTVGLLVATFFTQSRGPWIGLGFGLFVFFLLLLWQATRYARTRENLALATRLRVVLGVWVALTLLAGSFLIVFNLSDAPMFQRLREAPYLGRMGRLLEVDQGTGLVRRLIWSGDEHAGGAVELITADPVRMLIGWGPESMFVVFNRFYPPSLANVEARGASPDRSHQAILDELVTKGVLGLVSYLFVLISACVLCWQLLRRSDTWRWQVFFIACFSIIVTHFVEGLTGIPIVSTLMMFWVTLGLAVVGGMLAGHYALGATPAAEPARVPAPAPTGGKRKPGAAPPQRGAAARGAATARARSGGGYRGGRTQTNPAALAFYAVLLALTLGAVWWFNLNPVYADMRFQQGQAYSEQPGANLTLLVLSLDDYLVTVRANPREDFYYLNLGRTLMNVADRIRAQGAPLGQAVPNAQVEHLLRLHNLDQIQTFVQGQTPLGMLSYAEAVLLRARELNPLNKDHYANMGRLNNFWYSWTQDPTRLEESLRWYEQVNQIAPQDVTLLNERASVTALRANYAQLTGNDAEAQQYYARAEELLRLSKALDDRYIDTDARLADLYRLQGRLAEATDQYVAVVGRAPRQLDASIERIAADLREQPELLRKLRDAYAEKAGQDALLHAIAGLLSVRAGDLEQAVSAYAQTVAIEPQNLEYRRNYTIVLSDTQRYDQALAEARNTLSLAQARPGREQDIAQMQALIVFLEQKIAGGQ